MFSFIVAAWRDRLAFSRRYIRGMAMGTCFMPRIPPGARLTFDRTIPARDGDIVLIELPERPRIRLAKRIRWSPHGWLATSDNEPPAPFDGCRVLGVLCDIQPRNLPFAHALAKRLPQAHPEDVARVLEHYAPAIEYINQHEPSGRYFQEYTCHKPSLPS